VTVCLFTKVWREGTGWYAQALAQGLAEAGANVIFIAPAADPPEREPSHPRVRRVQTPRERVDGAARWVRVWASARRIAGGLAALAQARRASARFLFSIPEPLIVTNLTLLALRLSGAKVTFIVHDPLPHAWALPGWLRWLERGGHHLSYRLANRLIVLTSAGRNKLISTFGIPPGRIAVVPHGAFVLDHAQAKPPRPLERRRLLAFGTIRANKGLLAAIEAVKALRAAGEPLTLHIAGAPDRREPGYWQACQAAIAADPAGFACEIGFVPETRLAELAEAADAFLLPYAESFASQSGVAVLAGLSGRPVLATPAAAGDLFGLGLAGVAIEGGSREAIMAAIRSWRGAPPGAWEERCGEAAARLADRLAWDRVGKDILATLESEGDDALRSAAQRADECA